MKMSFKQLEMALKVAMHLGAQSIIEYTQEVNNECKGI